MIGRTQYESMLQQIQIPNGYVAVNGNDCFVKTSKDEIAIDYYLYQCSQKVQSCREEIVFFLEQAEFSFVGWHNASKQRDQKNRELEQELMDLVNKMAVATNIGDLDRIYHQVIKRLDNMHVGILDAHSRERTLSALDRRKDRWEFLANGKTKHFHSEELSSGLNIDAVKHIVADGMIDPYLIRIYVETIYSAQKQKITIEKQAKDARTRSTDYDHQEEHRVEDNTATADTSSSSEEDIHTIGDEEAQDYRRDILKERAELIERRSKFQLELDDLLEQKRRLESDATINGLFETETYETPIYREYPNPVDGFIAGYEERTRFKNGSDEERAQYREDSAQLEQKIKKAEEAIEVLTENIDALTAKAASLAIQEDEATITPPRSEERIFGIAKLKQAFSRLLGKDGTKDEMTELFTGDEEAVDDYTAGRLY